MVNRHGNVATRHDAASIRYSLLFYSVYRRIFDDGEINMCFGTRRQVCS